MNKLCAEEEWDLAESLLTTSEDICTDLNDYYQYQPIDWITMKPTSPAILRVINYLIGMDAHMHCQKRNRMAYWLLENMPDVAEGLLDMDPIEYCPDKSALLDWAVGQTYSPMLGDLITKLLKINAHHSCNNKNELVYWIYAHRYYLLAELYIRPLQLAPDVLNWIWDNRRPSRDSVIVDELLQGRAFCDIANRNPLTIWLLVNRPGKFVSMLGKRAYGYNPCFIDWALLNDPGSDDLMDALVAYAAEGVHLFESRGAYESYFSRLCKWMDTSVSQPCLFRSRLVYVCLGQAGPLPNNPTEMVTVFEQLCLCRAGVSHDWFLHVILTNITNQIATKAMSAAKVQRVIDVVHYISPYFCYSYLARVSDVPPLLTQSLRECVTSVSSLKTLAVHRARSQLAIANPTASVMSLAGDMLDVLPPSLFSEVCIDAVFRGRCHVANFEVTYEWLGTEASQ